MATGGRDGEILRGVGGGGAGTEGGVNVTLLGYKCNHLREQGN